MVTSRPITAATVKLDAVWLYRNQTAYNVNVYIDDVQVNYGIERPPPLAGVYPG